MEGVGPKGEARLLCGVDGDVHVSVLARRAATWARAAESLLGQANIAGVLFSDGKHDPVVVGKAAIVLDRAAGASARGPASPGRDASVNDRAEGGAEFWQSADAFAQASDAGNRALRQLVSDAVGPAPGRVVELFAGAGNFTRDLARVAESVFAVEWSSSAVACGRRNVAAAGGGARVGWQTGTVLQARRALAGQTPQVVVVDPPRTGLEPRDLAAVAELSPERIVYVSCDPMTLARDLARLATLGYGGREATPLDLMPQTFHVETVAVLERARS